MKLDEARKIVSRKIRIASYGLIKLDFENFVSDNTCKKNTQKLKVFVSGR